MICRTSSSLKTEVLMPLNVVSEAAGVIYTVLQCILIL